PVTLAPEQPGATLIVREVPSDGTPPALPWIVAPDPVAHPAQPPGVLSVYPSEVLAALQHLHVGDQITLPLPPPRSTAGGPASTAAVATRAVVRGVWRDYARQQGALLMARADWLRLTGDDRISGLAVWFADGTTDHGAALVARIKGAIPDGAPVDGSTAGELRAFSLRIFDRSFAVTHWLQGVALVIGLAGIAASFSAQVLARRREFGTLQHLGFTRRQVLALVACEGALWSAVGAVLGLALGLAVSVVLVKVVNPQSFHWTMSMSVPPFTLLALGLGVVVAGALTAWGSGHAAASRDIVRSVKEDW
ncbi:MAG: ABC transporter permease, partial [Caulobacter sp.]|nr:ABC transporter permease [Vitreoscilla sp.]